MSTHLLLTLGDPNGLGPELVCRVFGAGSASQDILIIGPEASLQASCRQMGIEPFWQTLPTVDTLDRLPPGVSLFTPFPLHDFCPDPGRATQEGGRAAGVSLSTACVLLKKGLAPGVVTCPLNKAMLQDAGYDFPGHTEFIARAFGLGPDDVCMHLAGPRLRVSLVTTHPPIKDVPGLITPEKILRCLTLTWDLVKKLDTTPKPIAVCGLNPHAGEWGRLGKEEIQTIEPAITKARSDGIDALGPFPADTLFHRAAQGEFSAVLAMYHDQGLAPLKLLHFHQAVNITLGLPVVRTSVDHGTGYDLVGTGRASKESLEAAVGMAGRLASSEPEKLS